VRELSRFRMFIAMFASTTDGTRRVGSPDQRKFWTNTTYTDMVML
jgi:hypothetical protein